MLIFFFSISDEPRIKYAVKVAHNRKLVKELKHEVRIYQKLEKLQGTGIPVMHDYGVVDETHFYIVFELCNKAPAVLKREHFSKLYSTLKEIHRRGITHGDVKMPNVMINQAGVPYLIDFAFACDHGFFCEMRNHEERLMMLQELVYER